MVCTEYTIRIAKVIEIGMGRRAMRNLISEHATLKIVVSVLYTASFLTAIAICSVCYAQEQSSDNFYTSFDDGTYPGWKINWNAGKSWSLTFPISPVRLGERCARFDLRKSDNDNRSELARGKVKPRSEHWYAFSFYVEKGDHVSGVIGQWHGSPDFDLGEDWRNPLLSLRIEDEPESINVKLWNKWAAEPVNNNKNCDGELWEDFGRIPKGEWTDWVFHIKWSWGTDGLVEVWKNRKQVFRRIGPNCYKDRREPYLKIGVYNSSFKRKPEEFPYDTMTIYWDEVRMLGPDARFSDLDPEGRKPIQTAQE
jgi:hypothetical protein